LGDSLACCWDFGFKRFGGTAINDAPAPEAVIILAVVESLEGGAGLVVEPGTFTLE
jgi:hypothetical protein